MLRLALVTTLAIAACSQESGVPALTVHHAEQFIGMSVPADATHVRVSGEQGRDELVLLEFEASPSTADDYATRLLGTPAMPGRDPGLGYLGEHLAWWPRNFPTGAAGGEVRRADNRTLKLVLAPTPGHATRVFVAAFSQ